MDRKKFIALNALAAGVLLCPKAGRATSGLLKSDPAKTLKPTGGIHRINNYEMENVVIGSGYGGAVAALRLAEKGHKVCILEMGLNWEKSGLQFSSMIRPGESAAWLRTRTIAPFMNVFPLKKFTGALDRIDFKHIKVWVGRGVGGGSLVNGGMAVVPKQKYFKEILPTLDDELFYSKYFPLVEKELKVNVAS